MKNKNWIAGASLAFYKSLDKETIEAVKYSCESHFFSTVGLAHYMAHEEFMKIYDACDDKGLIRGEVKRAFNGCLKEFERFKNFLDKHMEQTARYLFFDFCNQIYGGMKKEITDMTLTFKFYYERHGMDDIEWKAEITTTCAIINLASDLWHKYFEAYKNNWHLDFSPEFEYAKLDVAARLFNDYAEKETRVRKLGLHPTKNYASVQAFNAIADKMTDDKFIEDKSIAALKFNHYEKELNQIERADMGIDKLKEKYDKTK